MTLNNAGTAMARRWYQIGLGATIVVAILSFTPLLAWLMALLGLSAYFGWLDMFLLPLLGVLAALTLIAYTKVRSA